jgi:hypothetical protein
MWEASGTISNWCYYKLSKIANSDYQLRNICPSLRQSGGNNSAPTGRILMKFHIRVFFENLSRKFKFLLNITIGGTLHEDLRTFMITYRLILLTMIDVSDKNCRGNQNTSFMLNNVFKTKIIPFIRWNINTW